MVREEDIALALAMDDYYTTYSTPFRTKVLKEAKGNIENPPELDGPRDRYGCLVEMDRYEIVARIKECLIENRQLEGKNQERKRMCLAAEIEHLVDIMVNGTGMYTWDSVERADKNVYEIAKETGNSHEAMKYVRYKGLRVRRAKKK